MWPFKEKKRVSRPARDRIPTGRVLTLSSQGVSEPEIIQTLKSEGYTPLQVDQAMKDALKSSVGTSTGAAPATYPEPPAPAPFPEPGLTPPRREMRPEDVPSLPPLPTEIELPPPPSTLPERPEMTGPEFEPSLPGEEEIPRLSEPMTKMEMKEEKRRGLEEIAEAIIEEKWMGMREEIMNLKSQVQEINVKVTSLEQSFRQVQGDKKTDMEQIEDKIDTYKQSINEVSSRMESIEKAMKDSLTPMMQSMRSLTETIRTMKGKKE
jgi:prefoldin subunit 5